MQHYVRHSVANASSQSVAQPPRDPELCGCNRTRNLRESAAVNLNAYAGLLIIFAGFPTIAPAVTGYPGATYVGPAATTNYDETGRAGHSISYIVLHTTEGSMASALSVFQTQAASGNTGASAHYIVGIDGTIWQVVDDSETAYHCGNLTYNEESIGIEMEGGADGYPTGTASWSWETVSQRTAVESLVKWLHQQYGIPFDRAHIFGHNQVPSPGGSYPPTTQWGGYDNHHDPGAWYNWRQLMTDLGRPPHLQQSWHNNRCR